MVRREEERGEPQDGEARSSSCASPAGASPAPVGVGAPDSRAQPTGSVIDGRFWIQYDGTEDGIATQLVEAGVSRDRIVLAFKHPDLGKFTDFAAA